MGGDKKGKGEGKGMCDRFIKFSQNTPYAFVKINIALNAFRPREEFHMFTPHTKQLMGCFMDI